MNWFGAGYRRLGMPIQRTVPSARNNHAPNFDLRLLSSGAVSWLRQRRNKEYALRMFNAGDHAIRS